MLLDFGLLNNTEQQKTVLRNSNIFLYLFSKIFSIFPYRLIFSRCPGVHDNISKHWSNHNTNIRNPEQIILKLFKHRFLASFTKTFSDFNTVLGGTRDASTNAEGKTKRNTETQRDSVVMECTTAHWIHTFQSPGNTQINTLFQFPLK